MGTIKGCFLRLLLGICFPIDFISFKTLKSRQHLMTRLRGAERQAEKLEKLNEERRQLKRGNEERRQLERGNEERCNLKGKQAGAIHISHPLSRQH